MLISRRGRHDRRRVGRPDVDVGRRRRRMRMRSRRRVDGAGPRRSRLPAVFAHEVGASEFTEGTSQVVNAATAVAVHCRRQFISGCRVLDGARPCRQRQRQARPRANGCRRRQSPRVRRPGMKSVRFSLHHHHTLLLVRRLAVATRILHYIPRRRSAMISRRYVSLGFRCVEALYAR